MSIIQSTKALISFKSLKNSHILLAFLTGTTIVMLTAASADAQGSNSSYTVRETNGYVTVAGWEHQLVQGNPNLRHFSWMPVTSYTQGNATYKTSTSAAHQQLPQRAQHIYIKPLHIATIIPAHQSTHLVYNLPPKQESRVTAHVLAHSTRQVTASLLPQKPMVATYGELSRTAYSNTDLTMARQDVYGTIRFGSKQQVYR